VVHVYNVPNCMVLHPEDWHICNRHCDTLMSQKNEKLQVRIVFHKFPCCSSQVRTMTGPTVNDDLCLLIKPQVI
jgi:hypothetical protein